MKKIFTLLFALISIGFVKAQSLQLYDTSGAVVTNLTITRSCPNGDIWNAFSEEIYVRNISASTKQVRCKRRLITAMPAGMSNYFCWVSCYGPSVSVSPVADTIEISVNELVTVFHGYLNPNSLEGTCTIAYTFFDKNNPNDSATVNVNFISSVSSGIYDINKAANISEVFPNPSNGNAFIKINNANNFNGKKTTLKVYNVLGKEIASQNITSATETIAINNLTNLPSGVYFVNVYSDSKNIATKRFVIE